MLLVCRFQTDEAEVPAFVSRARRALELLTDQPGCLDATLARAADDPSAWLLVARFSSVAAYRRALSPFPVREHVVPLLAQALTDGPSVYEPSLTAERGTTTDITSMIAEDAATVRLGEAAGPATPR